MAVVKCIVCVGEGQDVEKIQKWQIISTSEYQMDTSSFASGCDVAVSLGSNLITHLKTSQNHMSLKRIVGGPCYTYGANRATATVYFEGTLSSSDTVPMKVSSFCEWIAAKEI